jgi:fluoride exporter
MVKFLLVALGGALGTGPRYSLSALIYSTVKPPRFPYETFIVNLTGSFLMGLLVAVRAGIRCAQVT